MNNDFYVIVKAFLVLKVFTFYPDFFRLGPESVPLSWNLWLVIISNYFDNFC